MMSYFFEDSENLDGKNVSKRIYDGVDSTSLWAFRI